MSKFSLLVSIFGAVFAAASSMAQVGAPVPAQSGTVDLRPAALGSEPFFTPEQKTAQEKAALALVAQLTQAVGAGAKQFVIPPGDYRFDGEAGRHFKLENVQGLSIVAEGVTFWFNPKFGVRLSRCVDVAIKGLTIDCDPLPWLQGTITAIDRREMTVDLELEPGYEMPAGAALDLAWRTVFFDRNTGRRLNVYDDGTKKIERLGERRLRIREFASNRMFLDPVFPRPVAVGDRVALLDRRFPGANFESEGCERISLERVCVYGAAGFGYHERNGKGGNQYLNCRLVRRPGTNRLMASRMDGFHSYSMEKGPHIEGCELSFAGDDLLAIHGFYGVAPEAPAGDRMLIASPYASRLAVGSALKFYRLPDAEPLGEAVVRSIEEVRDPGETALASKLPEQLKQEQHVSIRPMEEAMLVRVSLDRPAPAVAFALVASYDACGAGAVVKGNYIHDGNIRGVLAKTRDLTVENNVIERTAHGGIVLEAELFWLEGPFNKAIRIIGNRIADTGWSGFDRGGMSASLAGIEVGQHFGRRMFPRTFVGGAQNEDIEIRDNEIRTPAAFGILATNVKGLQISGNRIIQPFAAGKNTAFFERSPFGIQHSGEKPVKPHPLCHSIYVQAIEGGVIQGNQTLGAPDFLTSPVGLGGQSDVKVE